MWKSLIKRPACASVLLAMSATVAARGQDAQQVLDLIMQNAPPELKQKMEAVKRRQEEERRNPSRNVPHPIDAPSGPVDLTQFLRGNWVAEPFRVNCETGRVGEGRYVWGSNLRFEVQGNEIHEYQQQWGGPNYNCLQRIRHRVLSTDNTRKDVSVGFRAKQVSEIKVKQIDKVAISGGCSFSSVLPSVWELKYAESPEIGFRGRAVTSGGRELFSCDGEFRNFDAAATPTKGVR